MMRTLATIVSLLLLLSACRTDEVIVPSTSDGVTSPDDAVGDLKGFFLLNEGNMGSNKATLDYFDYTTGVYSKNIFAERNPSVVGELGDVGNDIQIYDDKIFAVINCSNLVEVMDLSTAQHIAVVSVPNCRYIDFKDNYAYVTSYAGAVQLDPNARLGYVAKIDLTTFEVVDECEVGYQPEQLKVVGDKLYVANSGGYMVPDYDTTLSVVDLNTFEQIKEIEVAINLHGVAIDEYGYLWVSSRGDYYDVPSMTYVVDTQTDTVVSELDIPNSAMCCVGDKVYILSSEWDYTTSTSSVSYAVVDAVERCLVESNFIKDGTESNITVPYGLAVNPESGELFVTDASNYVTPGKLYCYSAEGVLKWSATTGDIPSRIAFSTKSLSAIDDSDDDDDDDGDDDDDDSTQGETPYITRVLDFVPAPGQYTNQYPLYEEGDTQETMNQKVLDAIGNNNGGLISLGGYGGYVVVGFDHTIPNKEGRDFRVLGNAFYTSSETGGAEGGSCEPGIIMVAYDANGNGEPDSDEWYEIAGSSHIDATAELWYDMALSEGYDVNFYSDFTITYTKPQSEPAVADYATYIPWSDNKGNSGYIPKNGFHDQCYYPQWITSESLTFSGSRLPQNCINEGGTYVLYKFLYGYADNERNTEEESEIDIAWAVNAAGESVDLPGVDFIKIYTGVNQLCGGVGECSTEICGVTISD